jgi:hypothetical protein
MDAGVPFEKREVRGYDSVYAVAIICHHNVPPSLELRLVAAR